MSTKLDQVPVVCSWAASLMRFSSFRDDFPYNLIWPRLFVTGVNATWGRRTVVSLALAIGLVCCVPSLHIAAARDVDGRYAGSPLKSWFDSLRSAKGPCCEDADGMALSDVDWKTSDGHFLVRIEDRWFAVPDEAVVTEPNRSGRTMVWPIYYWEVGGELHVDIRCFMPGSMT